MTESKADELALELLNNKDFVEALGVAIGISWGLGENPGWFFARLVKKLLVFQQRGGIAEAEIIPMVFGSPREKEIHSRKNDLRSLKHAHDNAVARGRDASALAAQIATVEARLEELGA